VPANFDASASVAGTGASSITSYAWTFGDGTTGTGKTLTHTFTAPNNYSVTLTVTNDRGVAASTTQSVPVGASTLPTASFTVSPTAPGVGESVFFNAAASSAAPGRTIGSYQWSFGDGGTAGGSSTSHQYTAAGSYTVTLTVTDDIGKSSSTTQSVSIGNPPSPTANFTFSPSAPAVGDAVVFVASTSTTAQGQTITDYFWNFGDDPSCPVVSGTPPSTCYQQTSSAILTHAFTRTGTFSVNLVVRDSAGRIGSKSGSVSVTAGNPTASFTAIASGAAHTMLFDGSGSTAVGASTIRQYDWAFGDGSFSGPQTGPTVTHTYSSAGSYPVRLTVTDSLGRTGTFSSTVTVP
jgi:PKD repeat protein